MMLAGGGHDKENGSESSSGRLLRDIQEISRALYPPPKNVDSPSDRRSKSTSKIHVSRSNCQYVDEELLHKDKKSSIWNWNPLRALTHIRDRRFNCWFFLHVHTIEGLPSKFNDISFSVHWKRKDELLRTNPARVCQGTAEFEETLMHRCSVYGSRNGHHHSAKYEPKLFLLYASVIKDPGLDIGKHWIDLTRLLPLTLEELEEEKSSGLWTTSFKLAGKAKGAMLSVSFGFSVVEDNSLALGGSTIIPKLLKKIKLSTMDHTVDTGQVSGSGMFQRVGSVPNSSNFASHLPSLSLERNFPNEVFPSRGPQFARSISFLYNELDASKLASSNDNLSGECEEPLEPNIANFSKPSCGNIENDGVDSEYTVIEQGTEMSSNEQTELEGAAQTSDACAIEIIDVTEIFKDDEAVVDGELGFDSVDEVYGNFMGQVMMEDSRYEGNNVCIEQIMSSNLSISEPADIDSSDMNEFGGGENYTETIFTYKAVRMVRSFSLDDVTESIANDFLKMLAIEQNPVDLDAESEPESPRELLLKQFEEEVSASDNFIHNYDGVEEHGELSSAELGHSSNNFNLQLFIRGGVKDEQRIDQSLKSNRNAKLLEYLETEALMKEWGLNENVFQNSPRSSGGFGSPIYIQPEERVNFPPLGDGLGPIVRTKDGGFLRSMNPSLFKDAKNGGRLIMQVSTPIVLPMVMGSSIMEILEHWASVGYEKMLMQVNRLMPLEDINANVMQQLASDVVLGLKAPKRICCSEQESEDGEDSIRMEMEEYLRDWDYNDLTSSSISDLNDFVDSDYVSLEDLAPLVMDKIEALSIEGLRIQSGMSDEEAPSSIRPQSIWNTSAFLGKSASIGGSFTLEGADESQVLEAKDEDDDVDELISLSITLDEWIRLDSGSFSAGGEISERTSKILAAHLGENMDFVSGMLTLGCRYERSSGFLGNNFTVALKVQLRDPLRDYETVGRPMLALVEVERVFVDLRPKIYHKGEDDRSGVVEGINTKKIEEGAPWFKIIEVHVSGFNSEHQWGSVVPQRSGARWLLASGLGRYHKSSFVNSNAMVRSISQGARKMQPGNAVWSISSHVHGPRAKWKELATSNLHIRNPDVIFLK